MPASARVTEGAGRMLCGALAVTAAAMVATPLAAPRGRIRRVLTPVVVTGLFSSTAARAVVRWGIGRTAVAASAVTTATALVERIGTSTGVPFGRYAYTPALRPQLAGVPVAVPMAWFAMALPAREAAHSALGDRSSPARRVLLGAAALTAWDLFLDPQMTAEGFWRWTGAGRYRGIPLRNFAGWFVTGLGVMVVLELVVPPGVDDDVLVGEYVGMAAMETVGFGVFFGDRTVAAVGAAGMLPVAAAAMIGTARRGAARRTGARRW